MMRRSQVWLSCVMLAGSVPAAAWFSPLPQSYNTIAGEFGAISIADFTGDGRNDLLLTNISRIPSNWDQSLILMPQLPDGRLGQPQMLFRSTAPMVLNTHATTDLNGDNRPDIAVATSDRLQLLLSLPDGNYSRLDYAAPDTQCFAASGIVDLAFHDVDGDGRRDVVGLAEQGCAGVWYLDQAGNVRSKRAFAVPTNGRNDIAVGDIDHDGRADLVVSSNTGGNNHLLVFGQDGTGGLMLRINFFWGRGIAGIAIGDFDGDGRNEVVASKGNDNAPSQVHRVLFDGALRVVRTDSMASAPTPGALLAADVNGDGKKDAVVMHPANESIGVYLQHAGVLSTELRGRTYANADGGSHPPVAMAVGDLNNDQCPDIAFSNNREAALVRYGTNCSRTPLPETDFAVAMTSGFNEISPGRHDRSISAEYQVLANNEVSVESPRVFLRVVAAPPYTLSVVGMQAQYGSCAALESDATHVLYRCDGITSSGLAPVDVGRRQRFTLRLAPDRNVRVTATSWVETPGIVFDTVLGNQNASADYGFVAMNMSQPLPPVRGTPAAPAQPAQPVPADPVTAPRERARGWYAMVYRWLFARRFWILGL